MVNLNAAVPHLFVKLNEGNSQNGEGLQNTEQQCKGLIMKYLNDQVIASVGDITEQKADAIVNAANSSLMGGGGVDGAIHRKGGPGILEECRNIRKNLYPDGLPAGKAAATTAGLLPAKWVIHAVGPVWHDGSQNEDELLRNSYFNSLKEAVRLNCKSIAFPAISTGIYGFPAERAAGIVSETLKNFISENKTELIIHLIFFAQKDYDIFIKNQLF